MTIEEQDQSLITEEEFPQEVVEKAKVRIGTFLAYRKSSRTILDSNSNSYGMRVPNYNGKRWHHSTISTMKFRAYAVGKNLSAIMLPGLKKTLPATKGALLDKAKADGKKQILALAMNAKGVHALIIALETPNMMNKIMLERRRNVDLPFLDM